MKPVTTQKLPSTSQESNRRLDRFHSVAQTTHRPRLLAALGTAVLLAAVMLVGAGTEPAAASHLKQKCFPSGSKTVYQTSEGRFYTRTVKRQFGTGRNDFYLYKAFYACSYRYGRSHRLKEGDYEGDDRYGRFRISGHFAGFVAYYSCASCDWAPRADVTSLNLRTGEDRAYTGTTRPDEDELDELAHDLVLRRNGSIASIATGLDSPHGHLPRSPVTQVRALDAGGVRTLDEGPGISLRSLELDGTTVSWVKDGVRQSATLR